ncbi:MAG: hypothetical protein IPF60_06980 [Betaproteobacteria bacterium]|nr:hypothetical protein [Betaproteobacteria bacterium]
MKKQWHFQVAGPRGRARGRPRRGVQRTQPFACLRGAARRHAVPGVQDERRWKAKTNGALADLKIFTDSQLGTRSRRRSPACARAAPIDMAVSGSGSNFTVPESLIGVFEIPYLFKNLSTRISRLAWTARRGWRSWPSSNPGPGGLPFGDNGWRQMTNSKHPITKPEDVKA